MLHLCCGLPGSGKTTFARKFCKEKKILRLSSDDIRLMLYDDPTIITKWEFELLAACMSELLHQGQDVLIDATLLKEKFRKGFVDIARKVNINIGIQIHWFHIPIDVVLKRNAMRTKETGLVPESIIIKMNQNAEWPDLSPDRTHFIIEHNA